MRQQQLQHQFSLGWALDAEGTPAGQTRLDERAGRRALHGETQGRGARLLPSPVGFGLSAPGPPGRAIHHFLRGWAARRLKRRWARSAVRREGFPLDGLWAKQLGCP